MGAKSRLLRTPNLDEDEGGGGLQQTDTRVWGTANTLGNLGL